MDPYTQALTCDTGNHIQVIFCSWKFKLSSLEKQPELPPQATDPSVSQSRTLSRWEVESRSLPIPGRKACLPPGPANIYLYSIQSETDLSGHIKLKLWITHSLVMRTLPWKVRDARPETLGDGTDLLHPSQDLQTLGKTKGTINFYYHSTLKRLNTELRETLIKIGDRNLN